MISGNWIDFVIYLTLIIYAIQGLRRGFAKCMPELVSFVAALFLAIKFYGAASSVLQIYFFIPNNFSNALGFFAVWILSLWILILALRRISDRVLLFSGKTIDGILGIFPSAANGLITLGVIFTLVVSLPIAGSARKEILAGKISGFLVNKIASYESVLSDAFGGALGESLSFFTVQTGETKFVELGYKVENPIIDEAAENEMLEMINIERKKAGADPLEKDEALRAVARAHSEDMFRRGYFSHLTPEKKTLADRLKDGKIKYIVSGENLALSASVKQAMEGLMNSPGHKKNILSENYSKAGIGALKGGQYGIIFTQNFSN